MKRMKTVIKNAKINNEDTLYDIYFTDKIEHVSPAEEIHEYPSDAQVLDVEGNLVIPGGIDSHVHFNDPGFTHQEDFTTGTTSAAYGGITTIIDMPCTSLPPITSKENLLNKWEAIKNKALIDYAFWGGLNGADEINDNTLQVLKNLKEAGATAFKIYTISGMETYQSLSYQKIDDLFKLCQNEDFIFAFHAEDLQVIEEAIKNMPEAEKTTVEGYLKARPTEAEVVAIKQIIDIAKKYNTKVHIVHISSKEGLELVEAYAYATAETCPHYLEFTGDDLHTLKGRLKTAPVVKSKEDKTYLREALIKQTLPFVTTDHAGTNYQKNKLHDDFSKVYNGIPGVQFMLPYLFTSFYASKQLDLETMIKITSEAPAKLYGLYPKKGSFDKASDADFTILKKETYTVNEQNLQSKGKYSPFHGMTFKYKVDKTILRGKIIYDTDREINLSEITGYGKFLKSKRSSYEY